MTQPAYIYPRLYYCILRLWLEQNRFRLFTVSCDHKFKMSSQLDQYRLILISAEQKAQEDFDKSVLTLSSSALGVTFAFIKEIVGNKPPINSELISYAWLSWVISISTVLISFFFSTLAFRKAIKQLDSGDIHKTHPGGWYDCVTGILNAIGGLLFIAGVILALIFAYTNL
jgi:hypothetical protein